MDTRASRYYYCIQRRTLVDYSEQKMYDELGRAGRFDSPFWRGGFDSANFWVPNSFFRS